VVVGVAVGRWEGVDVGEGVDVESEGVEVPEGPRLGVTGVGVSGGGIVVGGSRVGEGVG
jgi:hypothetical protein